MIESGLHFVWNLAAFVVVLGVLVTVHEYGHFLVARRVGVHVLRFSVGFGRPLWLWQGKDGVEYCIARIPLGGYVRMLDDSDEDVAEELKARTYNSASVGRRLAIASAGPLANFALAVVLFWLSLVIGIPGVRPVVGEVLADSPAAHAGVVAGDEIVTVDGAAVSSWTRTILRLAEHVGESGSIELGVVPYTFGPQQPVTAPTSRRLTKTGRWNLDKNEQLLSVLGLKPMGPPPIATLIDSVAKNSPASHAGLRIGDRIVSIAGTKVHAWGELNPQLMNKAHTRVELMVRRAGQLVQLEVELGASPRDETLGYLGVGFKLDDKWRAQRRALMVNDRFGLLEAWPQAFSQTGQIFMLSVATISRMLSGALPLRNLSGPVGIAQGAGQSADAGLSHFIRFMAMISVSLGFLNLLPVPVLDGGHILFYLVELIRRKPVPQSVQEVGMKIGLGLILLLTAVAFVNDINRLGF